MIVYILSSESVLHETAHKMGLPHIFEDQYIEKSIENISAEIKGLGDEIESIKKQNNIWKATKGDKINIGGNIIVTRREFDKKIAEKDEEIKKHKKTKNIKEQMLEFLQKMKRYHQIYFAEGISNNIMDYASQHFGFFEFQFEIIKKLNDEYHHI